MSTNNVIFSVRQNRSSHSALKCLILIGFLWAQHAYGSHQLMHQDDEAGVSCQVCANYDKFENSLSDGVCAGISSVDVNPLPPYFAVGEIAGHRSVYSARASPKDPNIRL